MKHAVGWVIAVVLLVALPAWQDTSAEEFDDSSLTIMKPEPWLPPKYKSPRGTKQHIETRKPASTPMPQTQVLPRVPPPIVVPETGRVLPNLPAGRGAGVGGTETGQDRAMRCANQAGIYGDAAGNRAAYINSCINQ